MGSKLNSRECFFQNFLNFRNSDSTSNKFNSINIFDSKSGLFKSSDGWLSNSSKVLGQKLLEFSSFKFSVESVVVDELSNLDQSFFISGKNFFSLDTFFFKSVNGSLVLED